MSDLPFSWMGSTVNQRDTATKETRESEISRRAEMMANLGVPKKTAEKRLKAYLAWEYERLGTPGIAKRVAALVSAAYKRAGA